jgi:hypothetical protein
MKRDVYEQRLTCPVCKQLVGSWLTNQKEPVAVMRWHQRPVPGEPGRQRRCPGSNLTSIEAEEI